MSRETIILSEEQLNVLKQLVAESAVTKEALIEEFTLSDVFHRKQTIYPAENMLHIVKINLLQHIHSKDWRFLEIQFENGKRHIVDLKKTNVSSAFDKISVIYQEFVIFVNGVGSSEWRYLKRYDSNLEMFYNQLHQCIAEQVDVV